MSSWGWGNKISILEQVGDFSFFGSKSSLFFTSSCEAFFCEKLKKEEPFGGGFKFCLGTYNVPSGSRPKHLKTSLDELQFSFKGGDRGCVMRYLCFGICIYIVSVVTAVGHMVIARDCKRWALLTLRAQLNRNLWDLLFT